LQIKYFDKLKIENNILKIVNCFAIIYSIFCNKKL